MPNIRNEGSNPVMVEDILIKRGETVNVPDEVWKRWSANPIAKSIADTMFVVGGKGKAKEEAPQGDAPPDDDKTYNAVADAIREMIEIDPNKVEADMWTSKGLPDVRELNARTGLKLKSADRNAIWERYKNDNPDPNSE